MWPGAASLSTASYGINPYMYDVTPLYRKDSLDPMYYYNTSELVITQTVAGDNQTLFVAFTSYEMRGYPDGFPVIFGNTLDKHTAQELLDYMEWGHYYDSNTETLTVEYVVYNGQLDLFCMFKIVFIQSSGGVIHWQYSVLPVDVNVYDTGADMARLAIELLYTICILLGAYSEFSELFSVYRETGGVADYFSSAWNYLDILSIGMSLSSISVWIYAAYYARVIFSIELTYDIYTDPSHKW